MPVTATPPATVALSGRAMGVGCTVTVAGGDGPLLARRGLERIEELERRWSRFRPDSDISRINHARGTGIRVAPETVHLIEHMVAGFAMTEGDFNPTLLPLQLAAGDADSLVDDARTTLPHGALPFADMSGVETSADGVVRLPPGMTLDAGGIGKGLAADLVAEELLDAGAESVCVNVGGDLRVTGPTPDGNGWAVNILDPRDLVTPVARIAIASGAVATSSTSARHRGGRGPESHHFFLRDATDGGSSVVGATVVTSTGAWAEVWTKAAFRRSPDRFLADAHAIGAALLVLADGAVLESPAWQDFRA